MPGSCISRRDFLDGVAVGIGALALGGNAATAATKSARTGAYPPAYNGPRGSTNAAYAVGHAIRDGSFFGADTTPISTGERYHLVVVGGGISGLTAAYVYMRDVNPTATVLIIDNYDDVSGHARRNEFTVNGKLLIGYGGTQAIEAPALYSADAGTTACVRGRSFSTRNRSDAMRSCPQCR